jgi:radical SAM superfamily enzyme YgiQ (UPF0313 family)
MNTGRHRLLGDESSRLRIPLHGGFRIGVGYPNTYHVAQSSLAFQWVVELTADQPDCAVERFLAERSLIGYSLDTGRPLGDFDLLAWSCSFELDGVNLLRTLDAAAIPRRRVERGTRSPLLVLGGSVASINPLPLAPVIDVFVLGAAELLWPQLIELARSLDRGKLLEELAARDGYFVPAHHLDRSGRPHGRLRRLEKRDAHMADASMVPASHMVTPNTEYRGRALVEMSRGCQEKCRYCWASHNYGKLRCYPAEGILARVSELRQMTDRIGFVATAVGDHPQLPEILAECRSLGLNVAVSSLRIPAMVPEVLGPLAESGARSVTVAPETGSDALRRKLNKPISNARILAAVETAQECGIESLKMYFIVGLPGETDEDLIGIARLLKETRRIMVTHGRTRGRLGTLHAGFSILIPKPYTPFQREAMLDRTEARRRLDLVWRELRGTSNLKLDRPSYREALWQGFLSRGGTLAIDALELAADGEPIGRIITRHRTDIEAAALSTPESRPPWQFISSAPRSATGRPVPKS